MGGLRSAAAHVFVADLETPSLDPVDRHHLARVLRIRAGQAVSASDGAGRWRPCRMAASGELEPDGEVVAQARPSPPITVAFALTKGDRPEVAVQKLTEVGVDVIVAFGAERSVARWDEERAQGRIERLRRVAREAAMQSRRVWLPDVQPLATFAEVAGRPGAALAEPGGGPPSLARPTVLVGPEGGWSASELAVGVATVGLGPAVLRAETAAVVAGSLLVALRDGLVTEIDAPG